MKRSKSVVFSMIGLVFLGLSGSVSAALSQDEMDALQYMREEEKMARDVYLTLYQQWGEEVFAMIAESEQQHTDAIKTLLQRYGVDDPITSEQIGVFTNTELAAQYQNLVIQGQVSLEQALQVGGWIEETDMQDIDAAIGGTEERMIERVYHHLLEGSVHHLGAFVTNLEAQGVTYEAQVMTDEELATILDTMPNGDGMNGDSGAVSDSGQAGAMNGGPQGGAMAGCRDRVCM